MSNPLENFFHGLSLETFNRLKGWALKGGLAILDQGLFSGSNFIFNVLLARWLSPDDYGAFSLTFAFFLFFTSFHNAMILEPMSVFGTAKYAKSIYDYLSSQFIIHAIVTGSLGVLALFAGFALFFLDFINAFMFHAILGMGIFLPLILLTWLVRRAFYVLGKPGWAFLISFVYSLSLISGASLVHFLKTTDAIVWFGVIGLASMTGLIILPKRNIFDFVSKGNNFGEWKKLLLEQWSFGKWIMLAAFFYFAATQIQMFAVAGSLALESAGAFRALQNFMLPMMQVLTAISTIALPAISFAFGQGDYAHMRHRSFNVAALLFVFSAVYFLLLLFFFEPLKNSMYGGRYGQYVNLIPFFGIVPLITSIEIGFSLVVRALQRPVYHAILTFGMAVVGVASSLLLIPLFGVAGAVASLILVALLSLFINIWFYRKWFSDFFMLRSGV